MDLFFGMITRFGPAGAVLLAADHQCHLRGQRVAEGRLAAYSFVPAAAEPEAEAFEQVAKKAKVEAAEEPGEEEAFEVVAAA